MSILIIDYGAGNIESMKNALQLVKADAQIIISNKLEDLEKADHLILPGVGNFGDCMNCLKKIEGLIPQIKKQVLQNKKPFLGVCVGMQVLADLGYEDGTHEGLGLIAGCVQKITVKNIGGKNLKVPHMGWNNVEIITSTNHKILDNIKNGEHFYFANSYHFIPKNEEDRLGFANYGQKITAILAKDNIFATQFHPEKSGKAGLKILENFLK